LDFPEAIQLIRRILIIIPTGTIGTRTSTIIRIPLRIHIITAGRTGTLGTALITGIITILIITVTKQAS